MSNDAPKDFARELGPGGLEARSIPQSIAATRADDGDDDKGPMIVGYGSVSESPTLIEGYWSEWDEEVAAGAWAESIKSGDVRSMFNHDTNQLLGRTKPGTLRLTEDDTGLLYEVDVNPDDPMAMGVHARVARGDVDGSSVWFRVIRQEWTYPDRSNGLERPKRRILEGALMETGPVTFPAFTQTTASARALAPLDGALRAVGVRSSRRARLASDLAAGADVEDELRMILAGNPELRAAVCTCDTRAADPAPGDDDESRRAAEGAPTRDGNLAVARARLALLDRR